MVLTYAPSPTIGAHDVMKDSKDDKDSSDSEGEGKDPSKKGGEAPEPFRRLNESTLWKESQEAFGHREVWGSWYNKETNQWGYACCKGMLRAELCTAPKSPDASPEVAEMSSDGDTSPDEEEEMAKKLRIDWSDAPPKLLPHEEIPDMGAFIEHFIRYIIGAWRRGLEGDFKGFTDMDKTAFKDTMLQATQDAVAPLIRRLRKGEKLDRGEGESESRSRETRTSMEGKFVKEESVIVQINRLVEFAATQEYAQAHGCYMRMAFGNKMWNSTIVQHVSACTNKGAREYRRNRDTLNTYDNDPVSQAYMHALKKLVNFAQSIHPNADMSKNFVV